MERMDRTLYHFLGDNPSPLELSSSLPYMIDICEVFGGVRAFGNFIQCSLCSVQSCQRGPNVHVSTSAPEVLHVPLQAKLLRLPDSASLRLTTVAAQHICQRPVCLWCCEILLTGEFPRDERAWRSSTNLACSTAILKAKTSCLVTGGLRLPTSDWPTFAQLSDRPLETPVSSPRRWEDDIVEAPFWLFGCCGWAFSGNDMYSKLGLTIGPPPPVAGGAQWR